MLDALLENWKFITSYSIIAVVIVYVYKWLAYKYVMPSFISKVLFVVLICIPIGYGVIYKYNNNYTGTPSNEKIAKEFKSNQDSEYSQLWLDYLSFRDLEIGRLGSEEKFKNFLESKGMDERQYAINVIMAMLQEQGVEDTSIAEDCVNENIIGSLE